MKHRRITSLAPTVLVLAATIVLAGCSGGGSSAKASKTCPILLRGAKLPPTFAAVDAFAVDHDLSSPGSTLCTATRGGAKWTVSVTDDSIGRSGLERAAKDFALHARLGTRFAFDGVPAAEYTVATVHTVFFFDGHTYGAVSVATPTGGTPPSRRDLVTAARVLLDARDATGSPS